MYAEITTTILVAIAVVLLAHSLVWSACAAWTLKGAPLIWSDFDAYKARKANPPWFIRYSDWLDRRILGEDA